MPAVRASAVAAAARWVAASADGRMAVGGFRALDVVVGEVASPEELVRVTSLC
jgi:CO/xanthine dehydrogenase FAD-binding subunit